MPNPFDQFDAPVAGPLPSPPEKPEKPDKPSAGYRWGPPDAQGNPTMLPITGGPADPNAKPGGTENPAQVPVALEKSASDRVGQFVSLQTAANTFKDDFGGNPIGGLENWAQQYADIGTPGQRDWWAAFQAADNQIRNDLFGSALTASEKQAYEGTTIAPGMRPDIIRENITHRAQIIKDALSRQRDFMIKNGYRPEAVDAIFAPILERQEALVAGAAADANDKTPPAAAGGAGATASGNTPPPAGQGGGTPPAPPPLSPGDPGYQAATGDQRRVDDPETQAQVDAMLRAGKPFAEVNAYAQSRGMAPLNPQEFEAVRAFIAKNPNYQGSLVNASKYEPVSAVDKIVTSAGDNAAGNYFMHAGNFLTGNSYDSLTSDPDRARLTMAVNDAQSPNAGALGDITGGVIGGLLGEAGLARAGIRGLAGGLLADTGLGAANGAGAADYNANGRPASLEDRFIGGVEGGLASLAGSYGGSKLAGGLSALARGVTNPSVRALDDIGAVTTLGQRVGQSGRVGAAVKGIEDRLSGLPVVGDVINARRAEGYQRFNSGAFNQALKPINENVGDLVGSEAVEAARQKVQTAFTDALAGKSAVGDAAFRQDLTNAMVNAIKLPRVGGEVNDSIAAVLEPYMAPGKTSITGAEMQEISQALRDLKAGYQTDPLKHRIGKAIDAAEDAVFGIFKRQAPEVLPAYNAAKTAYRRVSTLADAVKTAINQTDQLFTPAQLQRADVGKTTKLEGTLSAASGKGPFHDFAAAGQEVLPNKVPDSGTAGRWLLPALALGGAGGGAGIGYAAGDAQGGAAQGLTLAAILAGAYSRAGQRLLTKPVRGVSEPVRKVLESPVTKRLIRSGAAVEASAPTR